MQSDRSRGFDRRQLIRSGAAGLGAALFSSCARRTPPPATTAAALPVAPPPAPLADYERAAAPALSDLDALASTDAADGGAAPVPIPWLDDDGAFHQPSGPGREPSSIFHFRGRVARASGFTGWGTDMAGRRIAFGGEATDVSLMQGRYWAGRRERAGVFAGLELSLFESASESGDRLHLLHAPIARNGLYRIVVLPENAVDVGPGGRRARLELRAAVVDQPDWPDAAGATHAARISCRIEWEATSERMDYLDTEKMFRFSGWCAETRMEAEVEIPALGFAWRSDPLETSIASFAILGEESNGRYFQP